MSGVALETYKRTEREMAVHDARQGFTAHAVVTAVVLVGLVALNVFVASEFPWSIFPVVGMSAGLAAHWYFGVLHGEDGLARRQAEIEARAARPTA